MESGGGKRQRLWVGMLYRACGLLVCGLTHSPTHTDQLRGSRATN